MSNDQKFNYVYNTYKKYVYNICLKYSKDIDDAHDYTHDAFMKVYKAIESVDINQCKTYITRITINSCIDNLRKSKKYKNDISQEDVLYDNSYHSNNSTKYNVFEYDDLKDFVKQNADKLGERYSNIFSMFVFDNYKHKEIAEQLNMNINTVRVDYMKARKKICDLLKNEKIVNIEL